ncbi:MAG: hypothetical protein ACK5A0_13975 [Polaromonas sp.]|jgi:hypothetical protein
MIIRGKPNVDAFLDGGSEAAKAPVAAPAAPKKVKAAQIAAEPARRTKKLFELPEAMIADLEQRCVDERRQLGRRVTQTEIVERALGTYLYGKT